MRRAESLSTEEEEILERLCQHPALYCLNCSDTELSESGGQRLPEQIDDWLTGALNSSIQAFESFPQGLQEDYDALKAVITLDVSNGPVEDQNNRLKVLKRLRHSV